MIRLSGAVDIIENVIHYLPQPLGQPAGIHEVLGPLRRPMAVSNGGSLNWFLMVLDSLILVHIVLKRIVLLDHCTAGGNRLELVLMNNMANWVGEICIKFSFRYVE